MLSWNSALGWVLRRLEVDTKSQYVCKICIFNRRSFTCLQASLDSMTEIVHIRLHELSSPQAHQPSIEYQLNVIHKHQFKLRDYLPFSYPSQSNETLFDNNHVTFVFGILLGNNSICRGKEELHASLGHFRFTYPRKNTKKEGEVDYVT